MAMVPEQRLTPGERANLVAYLDGELPEAEAQAIGTKLTQSATARREVEALTRAWELLDHLPRPVASESLTERTLTEARQIQEGRGRLEMVLRRRARHLLVQSTWVAVSFLAFAAAFAVTRWLWPDPTARLARDLSIAEHLEEYRDVGTLEFLKELASSSEFSADRTD